MGPNYTLANAGAATRHVMDENDRAHLVGQNRAANTQRGALNQQVLQQQALLTQLRDEAAARQASQVMPAPNIAAGYTRPTAIPQAPVAFQDSDLSHLGTGYESYGPMNQPSRGVPPPPPVKPPLTALDVDLGPYTGAHVGIEPYAAPPSSSIKAGTGYEGYGPTYQPTRSTTPRPTALDIDLGLGPYDESRTNVLSATPYQYGPRSAPQGVPLPPMPTPAANDYSGTPAGWQVPENVRRQREQQRLGILQSEQAATPSGDPNEVNLDMEIERQKGRKVIDQRVPGGGYGQGSGSSPSMGGYAYSAQTKPESPTAPLPEQTMPEVDVQASSVTDNTYQPGQEFVGGENDSSDDYYNFHDRLATQHSKMAEIYMLSGDTDRANQAVATANMARLEQYRITGDRALLAAKRGNPTALLSLMNFYDPKAGYSLRAKDTMGNVELLSNGRPVNAFSLPNFIEKARVMVDKAYSDQKIALQAKMYEEYNKQGMQAQREMSVADVKGRWDVRTAEAYRNKGMVPHIDSANGKMYGANIEGLWEYVPGVPIPGSDIPTPGEMKLIYRN